MANRRVAICQSAKVNGVWSYYKPVVDKIKPDHCHFNGHSEQHPGSDYIINGFAPNHLSVRIRTPTTRTATVGGCVWPETAPQVYDSPVF
jgi:hypothetical protein